MIHPKRANARVLLASVFGPYAQDDEFGSRSINPMELYHNQVTREQGPFSLRMFHRSWGILMIQRNISAPTTVLDFPTREAFAAELRAHDYDIVGISSIIVNVAKVKEMCRMVREISPRSTIVIGGHVTAIPGVEQMIDCDHLVRGDGISWMRRFLGEDEHAPIDHPPIVSGYGARALGLKLPQSKGSTAATIIPSVGCPMGCNFCTTSSFFGGKGKYLNFYETGDQLYSVMNGMAETLGIQSFFMMDENFLLHKRRAMQLLEHMKRNHKPWALYVFSSANAINQYTMRELVELGISWVWMGLESPRSSYIKLKDADTLSLTRELRKHGIKVLGSTIVGLEHHTPQNIHDEIEYAISHDTDFHQFMLYTPVPGTPLYFEMVKEGRMLEGVELADIHGQDKFNFRHAAISRDESKVLLDWAFRRDYERNGPSIYRISRTILSGYRMYRNDPDPRVRARFEWEVRSLKDGYAAALYAMEKYLVESNPAVSQRVGALRREIGREFGLASRVFNAIAGPVALWSARREAKRLAAGHTYEPYPIIERRNWDAAASLPERQAAANAA
jgi:radical SAM superfamily enzyme YgiQ (UPF0313 family)